MKTEDLLGLLFTQSDEWVRPRHSRGEVGITDYAQEQLSDIVFVEILVSKGDAIEQKQPIASIESVKAACEIYSPVSGRILDVNNSLADSPETINVDPYGKGWMAQIEFSSPKELNSLLGVTQYNKGRVAQEIVHLVYLDESNQIHYLPAIKGDDGQIIVSNNIFSSVLTSSIISIPDLKKLDIIDEFEYLINKQGLKEVELQKFFESHPEFLLGVEYERLYPQVVLKEDGQDELKPDFILRPLAGVSYEPALVELKLPNQPIVKPTPRRQGLYANIFEAVMQLRGYARYFDETENREYVRKVLGFTAYKPRLTLIVGKTIEFGDEKIKNDILESIRPIELVTYEDLLKKYKRMMQIGK